MIRTSCPLPVRPRISPCSISAGVRATSRFSGLGGQDGGGLTITPLNVSRYHRLGGGDIDRAIIHEVLLPQLLEQNGLDEFSPDFEQKRHFVQPALLGVAEALKQKLCIEVVAPKKTRPVGEDG